MVDEASAALVRSLLIILLVVPVGVVLLMEVLGTPDVVKAALTIAVISIGIGPPAAFKKATCAPEAVAYEVGLNLSCSRWRWSTSRSWWRYTA